MKLKFKLIISAVLLISVLTLSSCGLVNMGSSVNSEKYLTEDDVNKLMSGINQNVTVNGGDSYDITIESQHSETVHAASKALLSAVSIKSEFEITKTQYPIFGLPGNTYQDVQTGYGSGVIYSLDKNAGNAYIITNYHVVYYPGCDTENDISDNITVYLYGQEYEKYAIHAEYVGGSMNYDIAVLRVKNSNVLRESNAVAATFADSNDVSVLDTAIAIGNAEALGISATVGAVNVESEALSMLGADGATVVNLRVIRIDAAVNGGNSGGGLFNDRGEIIGIVNAKITHSSIDNIGYAIPSNVAKYVADNIIYYDNQDAKNDSVYRMMIGITVGVESAGTVYDTEEGKLHKYEKVKVESMTDGGPASGKLMAGDIINKVIVDGVEYDIVRTFNVVDVMLTARQNSVVVFEVTRGTENLRIEIDLSGITPAPY
ncbi:MAG: trypsin-like serine protease [Ruminococcaceae bacterium]|nr:trypsin-like serine protease [Oscillospiraceae bacterium]